MARKERAYKIRLVNKKTKSLEVNLEPKMQADGFVAERVIDWVKIEGIWMPKLRPIQKGTELGVKSEEHEVVSEPQEGVENAGNSAKTE